MYRNILKLSAIPLSLAFLACSSDEKLMSEDDFRKMDFKELSAYIQSCGPKAQDELANAIKDANIDVNGSKKDGFKFSNSYINCETATKLAFKIQSQQLGINFDKMLDTFEQYNIQNNKKTE